MPMAEVAPRSAVSGQKNPRRRRVRTMLRRASVHRMPPNPPVSSRLSERAVVRRDSYSIGRRSTSAWKRRFIATPSSIAAGRRGGTPRPSRSKQLPQHNISTGARPLRVSPTVPAALLHLLTLKGSQDGRPGSRFNAAKVASTKAALRSNTRSAPSNERSNVLESGASAGLEPAPRARGCALST